MKSEEKLRLEISGLCGIFAPIVAFGCILLSIGYAPNFSWTDNALSDLGVMANPTSTVFNLGLIVGGILTIVFASGLFIFYSGGLAGRVGALLFLLDALALTAIGIFPESSGPMHLYASVVFFALFPLAMFFMTAAFVLESKNGMAWFTFLVSVFSAMVWISEFWVRYVPGVAIPETLSALAASIWAIVVGSRMLSTRKSPEKMSNDMASL
jgi:hypothetical membrane protein